MKRKAKNRIRFNDPLEASEHIKKLLLVSFSYSFELVLNVKVKDGSIVVEKR